MNYREIVVECALRVELVMERMLLGVTTDDLNLADFGRSFSAIVRLWTFLLTPSRLLCLDFDSSISDTEINNLIYIASFISRVFTDCHIDHPAVSW